MRIEDEIKQDHFRDEYHRAQVNLMFTHNFLQNIMMRRFKAYDLSLPQYNILRILRGQHPRAASINLLTERMLDRMSNASRIVDKLLAKGLVSREPCPRDRRLVDILITEPGLDLLRRIDEAALMTNTGLENLTTDEARLFNDLLDRIRG